MSFCMACGSRLPEAAQFCGNCGSPAKSDLPGRSTAISSGGTPPAGAYGSGNAELTVSGLVRTPLVQEFLAGDWAGAARTVGAGIGAALVLAFVALVLMGSAYGNITPSQVISGTSMYTTMAVGGSISADSASGGGGALSFRPLGLTLVAFSVIGVLFVRRFRQRNQADLRSLGLQAGRTAVSLLAVLLILSLLNRIAPNANGYSAHVDVISTLFYGTVTLTIALLVSVAIGLPGLLPPRLEHWRTIVAGPLRAVLLLTLSSCALAFIVVIIWTLTLAERMSEGTDPGSFWLFELGFLLLVLPNIAGAGLLFGLGVPVNGSVGASFGVTGEASGSASIFTLIDHDQRFWLWPLATATLLVLAGFASARWTPAGIGGRYVGCWFGAVLPLALFVLAQTLSAGAWENGLSILSVSGSVGFDYLSTVVYGAIAGLAVGFLGTAMTPRRSGA